MKPFSNQELSNVFETKNSQIEEYIKSLSDEDVMSEQDDIIINNMYEKHKIFVVEIGNEILENREINKTKIKRYNHFYNMRSNYYDEPEYFMIDGVQVNCYFEFTGDSRLFSCRASTYSLSGHPDIEVFNNYFSISADETLDIMNKEENKNLLFNKIVNDLEHIKKYIEYCNTDVTKFNNSIKDYTLKLLKTRKEKADKFYNISKLLEIPISKPNPKLIEEVKVERKITPLVKRSNNEKQEYAISDEIYNDILGMIKHQGSSFERTPKVYTKLEEEELRDIILGYLNGIFKGQANGECFRKNGKTDISIEYENRAAFVCECKFWGGKKVLISALEQLQSYTTWRDNKLCLIIFSRNKDFFKVLEEIKNTLPDEENCIALKEIDKNEFEFKVKSKSNDRQIVQIRVFAFDLSN